MLNTKAEIAAKLHEWEEFLNKLRLPYWDELPTLELYMDQVIIVLNDYLDYYASESGDEKLITPAMVNNYVKQKLIPAPVKKKYGRVHLALLMMICTLKQTLCMAAVGSMLPKGDEESISRSYDHFIDVQKSFGKYFAREVKAAAEPMLSHAGGAGEELEVTDFVISSAVAASYAKLLTEKVIAYING